MTIRGALKRLGTDVRPGEDAVAWLLFSGFFLVITFQYVAKTVRQSTFIESLGATNLPWVYLLVAVFSYPLLALYLRFADRLPRHRLISTTCLVIVSSMIAFWWLYGFSWPWVPVAFYIWVTIVFGATVSQFWSFANHVLDARQAKRLFGLVGAGGLLGGIAGGQVARIATEVVGTRSALLVAATILVGVTVVVRAIHAAKPVASEPAKARSSRDTSAAGLDLLRRSAHLRLVGLVVVLTVVTAQVVDLQFNWAVEHATTGLVQRMAYYGNFFSVVGIAALVFQVLFTARIHRTLGVAAAMRVLPVTVFLGTVALLFFSGFTPELVVLAALSLKAGESGLRFSLDGSTRELLFLPVPSAVRVRAKAVVDVFLHRGAKGLAAILLLPVTFGLVTPIEVGWLTLVLVVAWMWAIAATYRTYVGSFRTGLKNRTMDTVVPIDLADVKTIELLVQSLGSADARQVLHSLDILEANGRGNLVPPVLLYHDDPDVRRKTLQVLAGVGRTDAAPLVERRLGDDDADVRAEAVRALTELNASDTCELMLPRLNDADPRVRAAAVMCLFNYGNQDMIARARTALEDMLSDAGAEARAEAIRAIGAIHGPEFDGRLLQALYDRDARVSREAIQGVRRVVVREGFKPLFVPRLISLLNDRRLKHDARETLVALGEDAIPILVHFLDDPGESMPVRRALPKALARIGGAKTIEALVASLARAEDASLRHQIVEALASRRDEVHGNGLTPQIETAIRDETGRCLRRLTDLAALGRGAGLSVEGPIVRWDRRELDLLTQMVAEKSAEHLETMFGLLALLFPPHDVWAAYRSLTSGRGELRAHALEYLDNTLGGEVRRHVFAVIDDRPIEEKLRVAERSFGIVPVGRVESVARFLAGEGNGDASGPALTVAGLYTVYTEKMSALYPSVSRLRDGTRDPVVRETAAWVAARLDLEPPDADSAGGIPCPS